MKIRDQWITYLVIYLRQKHRLATGKQLYRWAVTILDQELAAMDDYLSL